LRNLANVCEGQLSLHQSAINIVISLWDFLGLHADSLVGICRIGGGEVVKSNVSHLGDELLFKEVPVVNLAFMEVEQEQKEECEQVALDLDALNLVDVEEDVAMNLSKAQDDAEHLEVIIVLDVLVSYFPAPLALLQAVVVILEFADDLRQGTTLDTDEVNHVLSLGWLGCVVAGSCLRRRRLLLALRWFVVL